jgi:hypothetical protein
MKDVKIKGISFNTTILKGCKSVKEALQLFSNFDKGVVREAYFLSKKIK